MTTTPINEKCRCGCERFWYVKPVGSPIPLEFLIKCKKCGNTKKVSDPTVMKLAKEPSK